MNEFPPNTTTWKVELIPIFTDNYIFLITNNSNTRAVVVDPGEAESIQKILVEKKLVLTEILLTHHHQDHIGGVDTLKEQYPAAKIYAPLKNKAEIPGADFYVVHGQVLNIGILNFEVLELPGHTLGHVAYWCQTENWLFSGDVLFGLGCGRLFEGTFSQMFDSLKVIKNLPLEAKVFCTHEYTETNLRFCEQMNQQKTQTLIAQDQLQSYAVDLLQKRKKGFPSVPLLLKDEIKTNPFLKATNVQEFTELRTFRNSFK